MPLPNSEWRNPASIRVPMGGLLVFELDGGSWTAIEPLLEKSQLPHIANLIHQGSKGVLHSIPPLVSPALWTTIYTGQPRQKHRVSTFDATSHDVQYDRLWDIAHAHGITCGVCGSLVTWPPYDVGGFMIPDIMARDASTIPSQLSPLQELALNRPPRGQVEYSPFSYIRYAIKLRRTGTRMETMLALAREVLVTKLARRPYADTYWRQALLLQQLYTDAAVHLCRTYKPDLATYHCHIVDTLSHRYWKDHQSHQQGDDDPGRVMSATYQAVDRMLGQILKAVDAETTVLLISDHGFRAMPEKRSWYTVRLTRLVQILKSEGVITPTRLGRQHFLYFREPSRLEMVGEALRSAVFKETEQLVFPRVVTRDRSLFFLPPQVRGEGLTLVIPGYGEFPFEELVLDTGHTETGMHDPEGIVILAGPTVRRGIELNEASILDVAPTALALLGMPVARDMPGRVWVEAIRSHHLQQSPLTYTDTYRRDVQQESRRVMSEEDTSILYQRLSDLGYL